jgi:hypothetical protein
MANQRSKDKVKVQTYLHKDDDKRLREAAKSHGYSNLAEFFQAIARGAVKAPPQIKALALSAMGAQQSGGCGGAMCALIFAAVLVLYCIA